MRVPASQPGIKIAERACAQGALLGRAALFALGAQSLTFASRHGQRREQPEVDVHGLKGTGPVGLGAEMPTGNMAEERTERRRGRGEAPGKAATFRRRGLSGEEANGGAFHVAFAARDLAREPQPRGDPQAQAGVEKLGRIQEGVAVQSAEARKLRLLEARNGMEDAHLFAVLELGLEANHVPQRAKSIVLAQLHDGVGSFAAAMGVREADGFHGAKTQGVAAGLGHHLDRQAALKIGRGGFPGLEARFFGGEERGNEGFVLALSHGTINVVGARAAGAGLVIARLTPGDLGIDAVEMHDRRNGIEKSQFALTGELLDGGRQGWRRERTGGDDDAVPLGRRQAGNLGSLDRNQGMAVERPRHRASEVVAIDGERPARGQLVSIAGGHDQGARAPHLLVQQSDRVRASIVGAEGIGADELGQGVGLVGFGHPGRAHFVQDDAHPGAGDLPGSLAAGESAADDMNGVVLHAAENRRKAWGTQPRPPWPLGAAPRVERCSEGAPGMDGIKAAAEAIAARLKARGETLAVAESSAGGLISGALLSVPGASAYFLGGAVVYTRQARRGLLAITDAAMQGIRSASEPYAALLARTVRERMAASWGLAETGATGPSGNRYGDPAGHACLAVDGPTRRVLTLATGSADREANMHAFTQRALETLLQELER